jgi:hypothetical protein
MPIWLRNFTFNEIKKFYDEEKAEHEKANNPSNVTLINSDGTVNVNAPEFLKNVSPPKNTPPPSYTTKVSQK